MLSKPNEQQSLEQRAVAAMTDAAITSATIAALIAELTKAITQVRSDAAKAEEIALDPRQSPDLKLARERRDDALLRVGRLETLQNQLQRRFSDVRDREQVAAYMEAWQKRALERDQLAAEFAQTYPDAMSKLADLFDRLTAFKGNAPRSLGFLPPNCPGPPTFAAEVERVLDKAVLLDLDGNQTWPPPNNLTAAMVGAFVPHQLTPRGDLGAYNEYRSNMARAEAERQAAHLAEMTKQKEERENRELAEQFAATQRR